MPIKSFRNECIAIGPVGVEEDPLVIKSGRKTTADFDVRRHHLRPGNVGTRKKRTGDKKRKKKEKEKEREGERGRERERGQRQQI